MELTSPCACNCRPCECPPPVGEGCVPDLCVPRPCYFDGQLIGAADLNATVQHFRAKDLLLSRFVGGWGIYGGLALEPVSGTPAVPIGTGRPLTPNPQLMAGQTVQVSAGVAIDSHGRSLILCRPVVLDLSTLPIDPPLAAGVRPPEVPYSGISEGLVVEDGLVISHDSQNLPRLQPQEYFLVAEYEETPARPVPQLAGGAACDPAPGCDFSRKNEGVSFRLVPMLPEEYPWFGCLDDPGVDLPNVDDLDLGGDDAEELLQEVVDAFGRAFAQACCARPAVVLGSVTFVADHRNTSGGGTQTVLDDAYPFRRVVPSGALNWQATIQALRSSQDRTDGGSGGPHAMGRFSAEGELRNGFNFADEGTIDGSVYTFRLERPLSDERRVVSVSLGADDVSEPVAAYVLESDESEIRVGLQGPDGAISNITSIHVVVHETVSAEG
ncbi:MAG: hypothetical protein AAGF12_32095 [Myxococcota bacterium]